MITQKFVYSVCKIVVINYEPQTSDILYCDTCVITCYLEVETETTCCRLKDTIGIKGKQVILLH